jgi:hypothetical protein
MPSFLPKPKDQYPGLRASVSEIFSGEQFKASLDRVMSYLAKIYVSHSDGSFERTGRPGVITEQFVANMPSVAALASEIDLLNGIHDHSLGVISDEKVKVYLKKYLDTHTFVYWEAKPGQWICEFKAGKSPKTGREIALFYTDRVVNPIQLRILPILEAKAGNNVQHPITQL